MDIETVPAYPTYEDLPDKLKPFWIKKAKLLLRKDMDDISREELEHSFFEKAGIYAEFAKIICVSVGYCILEDQEIKTFRLKSFYGESENQILGEFKQLIENYFQNPEVHKFCGHNIREFDLPFLCRRMLIHRIPLPRMLSFSAKKPWQISHVLDTLEMWKFGDYKNYTSLGLLTNLFDIPSPKDQMDGSLVSSAYWKSKDIKSIVIYCEKDVISVARLYLKLKAGTAFGDDVVETVTQFSE